MVTVKVVGVDAVVRSFDRKKRGMEEALDDATEEASDYLIDKILDKFGYYQSGWEQLKYETVVRERKMGFGANATKPLVMSADMMFAFDKTLSRKTRKHVVWITNDDPKLQYHMYGAPSAGVPKRDPVRPTIREENEHALDIIKNAVRRVIRRS